MVAAEESLKVEIASPAFFLSMGTQSLRRVKKIDSWTINRGDSLAELACKMRCLIFEIGNPKIKEGSAIPKFPVQITYRNMKPSAALEANIKERAEKLRTFCDKVLKCRVIVEAPHLHHRKGKLYHIRISLTVPGGEVVVRHEPKRIVEVLARAQKLPDLRLVATRKPSKYAAHRDIYVAIRDAFDAARRKLQDYIRARRGAVKLHEASADGQVTRLFKDEGFGFLEARDGRELYFHENSVLGPGFKRLRIGSRVFYSEEEGEKGPQASTVRISGG